MSFRFDVHTLYFSEDAVGLESELHAHFASRRLNWANDRKEFFFATPAEVLEVLAAKIGNLLEFQEHAESIEYLQSAGYWPVGVKEARGPDAPADLSRQSHGLGLLGVSALSTTDQRMLTRS